MFVVCAQAPGRIDGVLVVLVVEVLITSHSACLVTRAARRSLAQLACRMAPRRSLVSGVKSHDVSYTDRCWDDERTPGRFHNLAMVDGLRADERYIRAIRARYEPQALAAHSASTTVLPTTSRRLRGTHKSDNADPAETDKKSSNVIAHRGQP